MSLKDYIHPNFMLNGYSFDSQEQLLNYVASISESATAFLEMWFNEQAYIKVYTSGSTGVPKEIVLKKAQMLHSARTTAAYFSLPATTRALLCLSTDYIAGKMMLVRALTLGWHLTLVNPSAKPLDETDDEFDFAAMVPIQLHASIDKLARVKKLIVGGGVVSKDLLKKLQTVRTEVYATYGMTETSTHIAVKKLNHLGEDEMEAYYKVLTHIQISQDERGCLVVEAPKLIDRPLVTNDIVNIISSREFQWLGRHDNIINSGGIKLIPEQIEEKLSEVLAIRFFASAMPDPVLGEKLVLILEDTLDNLEKYRAKIVALPTLSRYEIPKNLYALPVFAETKTKKIDRKRTLALLFPNS